MNENNLWMTVKQIHIQNSSEISGNFDIGFDKRIPNDIQDELRRFVTWVEDNFNLPVTLLVDFEYKHYLVSHNKKRVGYLFYWADFATDLISTNKEHIPVLRVPVRTEHYTMEEIFISFIEGITHYFAWILNIIGDDFSINENDVEEILQEYLRFRSSQM